MSLFSKLLGKKYEDLSTEVLVHLLSEEYSLRYPDFRQSLLTELTGSYSGEVIDFCSQINFREFGRPDVIGFGPETIIVIENKLISYLSGDDQLVKYLKVFKPDYLRDRFQSYDHKKIKNRILAVIAPDSIMRQIIRVSDKEVSQEYSSFFEKCCKEDIQFKKVNWQSIMNLLNQDNTIEKELRDFINEFIDATLTDDDIPKIYNEGISKDTELWNKSKCFLYSFAQQLDEETQFKTSSVYGKSEDLYFDVDKDNQLYFGFFKRAHERCGNCLFYLEIKNGMSGKDFSSWGAKHVDVSSNDVFICFDFDQREKWVQDVKKISEIVKQRPSFLSS